VFAHTTTPDVRELAQAVVPKPFDIDQLLNIIRSFVSPPNRETDAAP
jgi:hypothetical protein